MLDLNLTTEELTEIASMQPEDERCVVGKCPYCWEIRNDLLPTEGDGCMYPLRCAECDSQYTWCSICDEEQSEDDHCRHIFRDYGDYEWYGSGTYGLANQDIRRAFFRLLRMMPPGFPAALRDAVLSGEFYTFATMPMIGGGGHIDLNGFRHFQPAWDWGYKMVDIGQRESAKLTSDGYSWLASLYKEKTPDANRITTTWIEQYLAARTRFQIEPPKENAHDEPR